jgi:hypothetical protein
LGVAVRPSVKAYGPEGAIRVAARPQTAIVMSKCEQTSIDIKFRVDAKNVAI